MAKHRHQSQTLPAGVTHQSFTRLGMSAKLICVKEMSLGWIHLGRMKSSSHMLGPLGTWEDGSLFPPRWWMVDPRPREGTVELNGVDREHWSAETAEDTSIPARTQLATVHILIMTYFSLCYLVWWKLLIFSLQGGEEGEVRQTEGDCLEFKPTGAEQRSRQCFPQMLQKWKTKTKKKYVTLYDILLLNSYGFPSKF